jgi:uncharacterized protein Yka (UPF0111/DUF47 family)
VKRWFLPDTPDVLGLLRQQSGVTVTGVQAFADWSAGDAAKADAVRAAEHEADDLCRSLAMQLRSAFTTPLEPEDIYVLSERLDVVLNGAKNAVREAEVVEITPDGALADMAGYIVEGVRRIDEAYAALTVDADAAIAAADAATKSERHVEHRYRAAMSDLLAQEDLREVVKWREMYRRYARIGDSLASVANRVWYAVVKEG